jgi:hypothetical protein
MITSTAAPKFSGICQVVTYNKNKEKDTEINPAISKMGLERVLKSSNKARSTLLDLLTATNVALFLYSNHGQLESLIAITDDDKVAFEKLRSFSKDKPVTDDYLTKFIKSRDKEPDNLPTIYLTA